MMIALAWTLLRMAPKPVGGCDACDMLGRHDLCRPGKACCCED